MADVNASAQLRAAARTIRARELPTAFELAVAEWLEYQAAEADRLWRLAVELGDNPENYAPRHALAVARAALMPEPAP